MGGGKVTETPNPKTLEEEIREENMKAFSNINPRAAAQETEANEDNNPFFGLFDNRVSLPSYLMDSEVVAAKEGFVLSKETLPKVTNNWKVERDKALIEKRQPNFALKFVYCWTLLKSEYIPERNLGKKIMLELIEKDGYEHIDECIYILAHSCYIGGEKNEARQHCETLLRMRPDSARALQLHSQIRNLQLKDQERNIETASIAGAVVLGVAGLALALAAGGGKRK